MPESTATMFTHQALAELLVKSQGIHEGIWGIAIQFGLGAANAGPNDEEMHPSAIVPVLNVGIGKFHRFAAACLAISGRFLADRFAARAAPPFRPSATAALSLSSSVVPRSSSIYPVAILAIWTAAPMTSAGRFWPLGPLGIGVFSAADARENEEGKRRRQPHKEGYDCANRPMMHGTLRSFDYAYR